jgi:hypothetical protein
MPTAAGSQPDLADGPVGILGRKAHLRRPTISEADGPILQYRRWHERHRALPAPTDDGPGTGADGRVVGDAGPWSAVASEPIPAHHGGTPT